MAHPKPRTPAAPARSASLASLAASGSAAIYKPQRRANPSTDRGTIAKPWQVEAYRHLNICGEARYGVTLFAATAGRAVLGVAEAAEVGDAGKPVWVKNGPDVDAFYELVPDLQARKKLIRDYMLHWIVAGEAYLIARTRVDTDPGWVAPPDDPTTGAPFLSWDDYARSVVRTADLLDPDYEPVKDPNTPIWEIVAVTEIQKVGDGTWRVRHDNGNYLELAKDDPVIRLWNPDPENRREAWSPLRSMLPTLREIEWLTAHIFTQVKSRLMSAGVWFLPDNLTFPPPPPSAVEGGAEAIAAMNEAELFMLSLAASAMTELDGTEVSFPSIVMADAAALASIDQQRLIKFWSEIDDKAMTLRDSNIRRFALGMDLPPERVLGAGALVSRESSGGGGGTNHWGEWALAEQTITEHIEPALDAFVLVLTTAFLYVVNPESANVIAYDTTTLRLRPDRSKEAAEWYDRGVLKAEVALRENGFNPETDMMDHAEHRVWLLNRVAGGSATPEQVQAAMALLGAPLPVLSSPVAESQPATPIGDDKLPPSLESHPPAGGPPKGDHEHQDAVFAMRTLTAEGLVLRALEKHGNRLLNNGKRGKEKDRLTPAHMAHLTASIERPVSSAEFDFSLAQTVFPDLAARPLEVMVRKLGVFCADLTNSGAPYTREALLRVVKGE